MSKIIWTPRMNLEGTAKSVPSFLCGTQAALILSCTGSLLVLFDILKHFVYSIILLNFLSRRIFTAYLLRLICRIRDVIIRPFLLLQFHVICGYNPFRITYAVFSLLCCLIFFLLVISGVFLMLHLLYPIVSQKGCISKQAEKPDKTAWELLLCITKPQPQCF